MAQSVCSVPGCPELTTRGRCATHKRKAERVRRPDGNPYATKGHQRFRAQVLARDPICVLCHQAHSTVADHYPRSRADLVALHLDPDDPTRGRGLCKPCHDRETAQHQPGGWHTPHTEAHT